MVVDTGDRVWEAIAYKPIEEVRRILLLHAAEVCARIACDNSLPPSRTGMQALTLR